MVSNLYNNNEENLSPAVKALKELPKINAPENFEYNLMVKIQNGQFNPAEEEKKQSRLLWILTPAALVVTSIILFITFTQTGPNGLEKITPGGQSVLASTTQGEDNSAKMLKKESKKDIFAQFSSAKKAMPTASQSLNDITTPPPQQAGNPLAYDPSFNLDRDIIQGGAHYVGQSTQTAKSSNQRPEILLGKPEAKKDTKAVQDSIRKLMSQNDSMKLKKNIKR